ncbi:MAG: hypothetical protein ABI658_21875 [Acidimicrobiales bacterium]
MNEFDPSLDEIVSAYVDGAATPAERARVEGDSALVERAATFRLVRDALAPSPAPAADDLRHSLIARALADTAAPEATVHPLRSRRAAALGPIVAAAAVIALFFGLGTWLVASQDNNDDRTSTSAAAPSVAEDLFDAKGQLNAPAATTSAAAGSGASSGGTGGSAKVAPVYLGAFDNLPSLRAALPQSATAAGATRATSPPERAVTDAPLCGRTDPPDARIYTADLGGRPVTIVVTATRADMFDDATCVGPTNLLLVAPPLTFGDPRATTTTR